MTENKNSKKIRIKRAESFLARAQGKEIDDYFQSAIREVGSYFESSSSRRIGSGLTLPEEKLLLPDILGVTSEDREFLKLRNNFYITMYSKIPYKGGLELEIGLEDNSKPLSKDNLPLNLADYVRYRHHIKHPSVAESEGAAVGNQLKQFYVFDDIQVTGATDAVNEIKDDALEFYLKIKSDQKKVDMMLTLLGSDPRDTEGQTAEQTAQLRKEKLRQLIYSKPSDIVTLSTDKNFDTIYKMKSMVNTGVLKQVGTKYVITETGDTIGTYDETIEFFKDETANNTTISILNTKLQEALAGKKKEKRLSVGR